MTHVRAFALFTSMLSCVVFSAGPAAAHCERWESRYKMGARETFVASGPEHQILMRCTRQDEKEHPSDLGPMTEAEFYLDVGLYFDVDYEKVKGNYMTLKFDNKEPIRFRIFEGRITRYNDQCPECMEGRDKIISMFRKHKNVTLFTEDGKQATFTLAGAAEEIAYCFYKTNP